MKLNELLSLDLASTDGSHQQLLQRATRVLDHLPEATPGSQITLAFGGNREAFAASLLATWAKGHGAAIVENDLRDRIMPVLDRPPVAMLLHDTGSGRKLQVPRLLADADLPKANVPMPELTASPLLTVHVQTEDGLQHWCSWHAEQLRDAIVAFGETLANNEHAAPTRNQAPGLISSLFANTLLPMQQGIDLASHTAIDAAGLPIAGVPDTTSAHQQTIDAMLANDGITDAAVTCTEDGRVLTALAGPRANELAGKTPNALAWNDIPRDPNGQVLAPEIFLAFGLGRSGNEVSKELNWQYGPIEPTQASMRCHVPTNYVFYEGHFTNYPVLAGGAQLHELVLPCLRQLCDALPQLERLDSVKFLARVTPGDVIDVVVRTADDRQLVTFEVRKANEDVRCTSGRLHFATTLADFAERSQDA